MVGGIVLLSVMASFYPPSILIPLHGAVQLLSNGFRLFFIREFLRLNIVFPFAVGAVMAGFAGGQFIIDLPVREFQIGLALFILLATWAPKLPGAPVFPGRFLLLGFFATFLSFFVGATGLIIGPFFLREAIDRRSVVACQAACQVLLHATKVVVFWNLGAELTAYSTDLLVMGLAVLLGSWMGTRALGKISEELFRRIVKLVVSLLALRLLLLAIWPDFNFSI